MFEDWSYESHIEAQKKDAKNKKKKSRFEDWSYEGHIEAQKKDAKKNKKKKRKEKRKSRKRSLKKGFLGMTPTERFILATMMMVMTCILGAFCLMITNRILIPFL